MKTTFNPDDIIGQSPALNIISTILNQEPLTPLTNTSHPFHNTIQSIMICIHCQQQPSIIGSLCELCITHAISQYSASQTSNVLPSSSSTPFESIDTCSTPMNGLVPSNKQSQAALLAQKIISTNGILPLSTTTFAAPPAINPYLAARSQRLANPMAQSRPKTKKPYLPPVPRAGRANLEAKDSDTKTIHCGFEVFYHGKCVGKKAAMKEPHLISLNDPCLYHTLFSKLCNRFKGRVMGEPFGTFNEPLFPYCTLGSKKGAIPDGSALVDWLKTNKQVDLIYKHEDFVAAVEDGESDSEGASVPPSVRSSFAMTTRSATLVVLQKL